MPQPIRSVVLDEVGSTNVEAMARAAAGETGPLWIVARRQTAQRFGIPDAAADSADGKDYVIPRQPHWGGYYLWAESVELWVEGEARIHDRARWSRTLTRQVDPNTGETSFDAGPWTVTRLQP